MIGVRQFVRASCTATLADPEDARTNPRATLVNRTRVKELSVICCAGQGSGRGGGLAGSVKKVAASSKMGENK